MIEKRKLKELFNIVKRIDQDDTEFRKNNSKGKLKLSFWVVFFWLPLAISLILLCIAKSNESLKLIFISLCSLSISYVFLLFSMFWDIFANKKALKAIIKEPFSIILDNAEILSYQNIDYYNYFLNYNLDELHYFKSVLIMKKDSISTHIAIMSGFIGRAGLLPGILSLIIIFTKPVNEINNLIITVAMVIPILQAIGIGVSTLLLKLEKIIKLVDVVIENHRSINKLS